MNRFVKSKKNHSDGFTLLEVVIALAVFGFLIGGLLGFLPWGVEGVGKIREQNIAYGIVDAVQIELERMGFKLVEKGTNRCDNYEAPNPEDLGDKRWDLLLVAPKDGGRVAFEQVVEFSKEMMNSSASLIEGNKIDEWYPIGEAGVRKVPFNMSDPSVGSSIPLSLSGIQEDGKEASSPWSSWWIPEEDRYFLIKCTQYPLTHRHRHHPSNGFLALQVDVQWPYKIPDPSNSDGGYRRISQRYRTHFTFPMAITR